MLLASAAGMAFFVGSANLMVMFLALEWFSIALYVMCAIDYDVEGSLEAGLKYLVIGSFGSAALLFGSALVYGATGRLGFAEIAPPSARTAFGQRSARARARDDHRRPRFQVVGGAVPHVDAGRSRRADDGTAFMSAATKVAAFALAFRVIRTAFPQEEHLWTWAFAGIAVASLASATSRRSCSRT